MVAEISQLQRQRNTNQLLPSVETPLEEGNALAVFQALRQVLFN